MCVTLQSRPPSSLTVLLVKQRKSGFRGKAASVNKTRPGGANITSLPSGSPQGFPSLGRSLRRRSAFPSITRIVPSSPEHIPDQLGDVFFQALAPDACTMGTQPSEASWATGSRKKKLFMSHKKALEILLDCVWKTQTSTSQPDPGTLWWNVGGCECTDGLHLRRGVHRDDAFVSMFLQSDLFYPEVFGCCLSEHTHQTDTSVAHYWNAPKNTMLTNCMCVFVLVCFLK